MSISLQVQTCCKIFLIILQDSTKYQLLEYKHSLLVNDFLFSPTEDVQSEFIYVLKSVIYRWGNNPILKHCEAIDFKEASASKQEKK